MAIDYNSGPNSLFPRIGRSGKILYGLHGIQAAEYAAINDKLGRYPVADQQISATLALAREGMVRSLANTAVGSLRLVDEQTLQLMVAADQPTRAGSVYEALVELIRQMTADGQTVKAATVTAVAAPFAGNVGTQVLVVSPKRGDGRFQELLVAEAANVRCTQDARTPGAPPGSDQFTFVGVPAGSSTQADYDWPLGSAARTTLPYASALSSAVNQLANGGFDGTWASVTPPGWTKTGAIAQETATVYATGTAAVKVAAGATPVLTQLFGNATAGTRYSPAPLTSLGFCLFARAQGGVPAAGVLRVELWGAAGVVNDATGNPARADFALAASLPVADTWYPLAGVIRTPKLLPAGLSLRVNVQTGPSVPVLYDHFALVPLTACYNGGPGAVVFAGDVPPATGDGWTVTATNDRGGSLYGASFNTLFDRLYGLRNLAAPTGLLLPSAAVPTLPDTLITA